MLAVLQPDILLHCACAQLCLFPVPWTIAGQAPLSMGFPRQEYWSGLSFPSPGDLPYSGIEPVSPASPTLASGFSLSHLGSPLYCVVIAYLPVYLSLDFMLFQGRHIHLASLLYAQGMT